MNKLSLVFANNPALKKPSKKITLFNDELQKLAYQMVNCLKKYKGVGLTASQVGKNIQLLVIESKPIKQDTEEKSSIPEIPLTILVNPEIIKQSGEEEEELEGCLSFPGLKLPIKRTKRVALKAQNIFGKKIKIKASDLFSRIIQHEVDHLKGILITERTTNQRMVPANLRVACLGEGDFARPIFEQLEKVGYQLVEQNNQPDLLVVADYGRILLREEIEKPAFGAINIHPSLLPKYRGASPIQAAILAGEKESGISIIKMDEKIDHGPLLVQAKIEIKKDDDYPRLRKKLAQLAADLAIRVIPFYTSEQIKPRAQEHEKATYVKKIKKSAAEINWQESPQKILRQIRAYAGWPIAYTLLDGKRLQIYRGHLTDNKLVLDEVQLEGKKRMSFEEFKKGYRQPLKFPKLVVQ